MFYKPTPEEIEKDFRNKLTEKFKSRKLTKKLQEEIEQFIHIYLIEINILYGTGENEPKGFLNLKEKNEKVRIN